MSEQMSATIIAFPRMRDAAADPYVRLQRALAMLEQALAEQRAAVADWRQSLGALHAAVQSLGASLGTCNARLGTLADDVDGLNRAAGQMQAWADGVLAQP